MLSPRPIQVFGKTQQCAESVKFGVATRVTTGRKSSCMVFTIKPKPEYVSEDVQALLGIPTYGENHELQANRIDAKIVNHKSKDIVVL